jgi:hypothetical protein
MFEVALMGRSICQRMAAILANVRRISNDCLHVTSAQSYVLDLSVATCQVIGARIRDPDDASQHHRGGHMEHTAATPRPTPRVTLGQWLVIDTLTCIAFGTLLVAAAAPLSTLLGLPQSLLFYAGLVLFPCAALMALAARTLARPLVLLVVAGNAAWIAASIAVIFAFAPTGMGLVFVTLQAAAVGALAIAEWRGATSSM